MRQNAQPLKRLPADVIHSLMADLRLRIRKTDSRLTVITADGRDWVLKYKAASTATLRQEPYLLE